MRRPIEINELKERIRELLQQWTDAGIDAVTSPDYQEQQIMQTIELAYTGVRPAFTAYNVTVALRSAYPADEIDHMTVYRIVKEQMRSFLDAGAYYRLSKPMPLGQSSYVYVPNPG